MRVAGAIMAARRADRRREMAELYRSCSSRTVIGCWPLLGRVMCSKTASERASRMTSSGRTPGAVAVGWSGWVSWSLFTRPYLSVVEVGRSVAVRFQRQLEIGQVFTARSVVSRNGVPSGWPRFAVFIFARFACVVGLVDLRVWWAGAAGVVVVRARRILGLVVAAGVGVLVEWDRRAWSRTIAELEGVELGRVRAAGRAMSRAAARAVRRGPVVGGLLLDRPSEAVEGGRE